MTDVIASNAKANPTILYIVGEGRSGSTLLDMLLGQVDSFESVGELHFIWLRGLRENQRCGCGVAFNACNYWNNIIEKFNKENNTLTIDELADYTSIDSMKKFPGNYLYDKLSSFSHIKKVFKSYDLLYRSIASETGSNIIIDSSKSVPFAFFLAKYSKLDIKFIHMIRDSRAVTFSRQKKKIRSEITDTVEYMPTVSSWKSSLKWLSNNMVASFVIKEKPFIRVTYEGFINDPKAIFDEISEFLKIPKADFDGLVSSDKTSKMSVHHTVSGNPSRFNSGDIKIELDDRWKTEMLPFRKWMVTVLTWPLLKIYY